MNKDHLIVWICGVVIGFILAMLLFSGGSDFEGVAEINWCLEDTCIQQGIYRITGYNQINISKYELDFKMKLLNDAILGENNGK